MIKGVIINIQLVVSEVAGSLKYRNQLIFNEKNTSEIL